MYRSLSSCALIFVALLAGTMATGCSLFLEPDQESQLEDVQRPPLLVFEKPHTGLLYTAVDDRDAALPGLQLEVLVRVHDFENGIGLEDIEVVIGDEQTVHRVRVRDERDGRFARLPLFTVPFASGREAIHIGVRIPSMVQESAVDAYDDALAELLAFEEWVIIDTNQGNVHSPTNSGVDVVIDGDVTIHADSEIQIEDATCFGINGDLRIEGSSLQSLATLNGLQFINGDLIIVSNGDLRDLSALRSLTQIGGHFRVEANKNLPTKGEVFKLRDHIGLSQIGGVVSISDNGPG